MRRTLSTFALASIAVLPSCSDRNGLAPEHIPDVALGLNTDLPVRISEFHYDNSGTDAGEAIEVSGPAGFNLSGYSIVLYNGTGGAVYDTDALSGTIPATCGSRGVVVLNYPSNGIQNGSPDGIALVGPSGVIEFLSYEGTFTGVGGAANGMVSIDIGVSEAGTEPAGQSLARKDATTTWAGPAASSFGACNDENEPPPVVVDSVEVTPNAANIIVGGTVQLSAAAYDNGDHLIPGTPFTWMSESPAVATVNSTGLVTGVSSGNARIIVAAPNGEADTANVHVDPAPPPGGGAAIFSEIHYDNSGADVGEAIEIQGDAGTSLTGWSIVLYNGNGGASYATIALTGLIANQCSGKGTVSVSQAGIQNGNPDGFALVNSSGQVVEFLSYGGTFQATNGPASGTTSIDIGVTESASTPAGRSLQRDTDGTWFGPVTSSFGACNAPKPPPTISISGRLSSDPPLPVGFEDQIFASLVDASGIVLPTTFTWASETPLIASIDQNGVMRAIAAGTAVFRATAANGTTSTYSLPTAVATLGGAAQYGNNIEFGQPADGSPGDDIVVNRAQFNASFNPVRGIPNWVSYNLEATHFGSQDRCDCFTFDPALPSSVTPYNTNNYTGAGAAAGFGIDRGHLARSFDRTTGSLDNAYTFLFTNIIPQTSAQNQGPWAAMETFLGDLARFQNRELYIVAGASGSRGTVKNEGRITIPSHTWKVAVIMDRNEGLANVIGLTDVEVIAVIMPNDPAVNADWNTYRTTVDAVEALSGYNLLALLPDQIEIAVESMTRPPVAATNGPWTGSEGSAVSMSGASSSDPDAGDVLSYAWNFGDGTTGSGISPSHSYAQDGSYTVQLTVTDSRGLTSTVSTTANISNVTPAIGAIATATLFPGETYAASAGFTDPGADSWTGTVNYGDGSGTTTLALSGKTFSLSHAYSSAGTFTVTVQISDDDVSSSRSQSIVVLLPAEGLTGALTLLQQLVNNGAIKRSHSLQLMVALTLAIKELGEGSTELALLHLDRSLKEINSLVTQGKATADDLAALKALLTRIRQSVGG